MGNSNTREVTTVQENLKVQNHLYIKDDFDDFKS